jgi:Protein of unknown function (DUF3592)
VAVESNAGGGDAQAQGWYLDPYGVHEQRWISQGRQSNLVRDGRIEAKDPPPDGPPNRPFIKVTADPRSMSIRDMIRADGDKEAVSPDLGSYAVAAMDANVVFDTGLVGAPVAEGALKGGRYGRSRSNRQRQPRQPAPRWYPVGFILLAVIGALLLGIGISEKAPAHQVQGSVVSAASSGIGTPWVCTVNYSVPGRGNFAFKVTQSTVPGSADDCGAGQQVTVSYDPTDPSVAHLVSSGFAADVSGGTASGGELVAIAGGIALILAVLWAFDWWRRRPLG